MGLDVYLHDRSKAEKKTEDYGDGETETWFDYSDSYDDVQLRSSYNSSGFNGIVSDLTGLHGFYYIFAPVLGDEGQYEHPLKGKETNLADARQRAEEVKALLEKAKEEDSFYGATDVFFPSTKEQLATSSEQAMQFFRDQQARDVPRRVNEEAYNYSTATGFFSMKGFTVHAVIPGLSVLGSPCVYLVYKMEPGGMDYYIDQADRAIRLCDLALKMLEDESSEPVICWSA